MGRLYQCEFYVHGVYKKHGRNMIQQICNCMYIRTCQTRGIDTFGQLVSICSTLGAHSKWAMMLNLSISIPRQVKRLCGRHGTLWVKTSLVPRLAPKGSASGNECSNTCNDRSLKCQSGDKTVQITAHYIPNITQYYTKAIVRPKPAVCEIPINPTFSKLGANQCLYYCIYYKCLYGYTLAMFSFV